LNTKFIYTDYRSSEVQTADGNKRRIYSPVPESRVPAEGNFGEGEHMNFTFADYLREPIRMNIALSVPPLLRTALQSFLAGMQSEIQAQPACNRIKGQGDGFLIFSTDSLWLFEIAQQLGSRLDQFKLRNPSSLGSFRCALNRGRLNCVMVDDKEDLDGDALIECARIDQPMKAYLKEHGIVGNQVWCTEAFKADLEPRSPHLRFSPLPPIPLDKGYESKSQLFMVTVA
jgi:hypothetical protein